MTYFLVSLPKDPILADLLEERGYVEAANTLRGQGHDLQFTISEGHIHSFDPTTNTGRVYIENLKSCLYFYGPSHL